METEDKKLITDFLEGDADALALLIERNLKLVYRYAFRITRDTEDAEDITQETFVKLWKNIEKFDSDKNFRTWLLGIAHNTSIDLLRKRKSFVFSDFETSEGGNSITETIADPSPLAPEIFEQAEKRKLLDTALAKLPFMYREVLTLYFDEDLTFSEIGEILGKPLNTVKSQQRRALESLRKILKDLI